MNILSIGALIFGLHSVISVDNRDWMSAKKAHFRSLTPEISEENLIHFGCDLADEDELKTILQHICIARPVGSANYLQVQKYITDYMKNLRWDVEHHTFQQDTIIGRKNFTNIIATLNPQAHRRMVMSCHYDSKIMKEGEFIGATDSAVPCAQMMNLATTMKSYFQEGVKSDLFKDVSIQFLFFDGEEAFGEWTDTDSLYGSRRLAKNWHETPYPEGGKNNYLDRMDLMILLDLIGGDSPDNMMFRNAHAATSAHYEKMEEIETKLKEGNLFNDGYKGRFFYKKAPKWSIEDDHIPFLDRGVPILHLISVPFPNKWHTLEDTCENVNFDSVDNLNKILRVFVAHYFKLKK